MRQTLLRSLFPHAIGHHLGMEVHDTSSVPLSQPFAEGHCITVEPGLYFIDVLLDMALANPDQRRFMVEARLNDFRGTGGVRLEGAAGSPPPL